MLTSWPVSERPSMGYGNTPSVRAAHIVCLHRSMSPERTTAVLVPGSFQLVVSTAVVPVLVTRKIPACLAAGNELLSPTLVRMQLERKITEDPSLVADEKAYASACSRVTSR